MTTATKTSTEDQLRWLTHKYMNKARALFPELRYQCSPAIAYTAKGRYSGKAHVTNRIEYNLAVAEHNGTDAFEQTCAHEVAHLVAFWLHGDKAWGHGRDWKRIMRLFGFPNAKACTDYDIPEGTVRRQRRFAYTCNCPGEQHGLSATIHNRIRAGRPYRCKRCKGALKRA